MSDLIKLFKEIHLKDIPLVGGKNASLGEMANQLAAKGIQVPDGFATTATAYRRYLQETGLGKKIQEHLKSLNANDTNQLTFLGRQVRQTILKTPLPSFLRDEIEWAYQQLCRNLHEENLSVAIRSSATAEDLPDASFAGQQETYLNVRGDKEVLEACHKCFASLFTDRAIFYRQQKGFDHMQVALSIGVQKMVRSDLASSGVIFTLDTESGFRDVVFVTSSYGLGENIVQGVVNPDEFYVFKPTLKKGFHSIIEKTLGTKEIKMIYDTRGGSKLTRNVPVSPSDRQRFSLSDEDVLQLARWAIVIEEHYGRPMDIEWGKDGLTQDLYILQARPETVHARSDRNVVETYILKKQGKILSQGKSVGTKIGQGNACVIRDAKDKEQFQEGQVLIAEMTDPDWVPIMKKASAIVTERGGRTCHAAIISRELGIPAVVGATHALETILSSQPITVSCAEGSEGYVYEGMLAFETKQLTLQNRKPLPVKIMMNVARPDKAFDLSFLPNDGVGLARLEFIISSQIQIHPMALIRYPKLQNLEDIKSIEKLTLGYKNKPDYFVEKLSQGVGKIAAAFYPKEVIVRLSDFKTNEYAGLIGGKEFEPSEENPMIGFRGASRYYDDRYRQGFALECKALKKVRNEMGLDNIKIMIPFCRTVEEASRVLTVMADEGLKRGENGLQITMMCEIPSNIILVGEFSKLFDGFSIGSNDLTQMVLGLDRDSEIVSHLFNERNPAVMKMIRMAIRGAKQNGIPIGICGQAPSDYPEFAKFLIDESIDSISLNPDAILKVIMRLNGV